MRSLKVIFSLIIAVLAVACFNEPACAATITAPTSISANTTWTSDNVYVISSYTVVQPGIQLTIQPGTVVKFQGSAYMNVKGTLQAPGTGDNNMPVGYQSQRRSFITNSPYLFNTLCS